MKIVVGGNVCFNMISDLEGSMKLPKAKKMNLSSIFTSDQLKKDKEEGTSDKAYYNLCNKAYMQTLTTQWTKCVKEKNNRFQ